MAKSSNRGGAWDPTKYAWKRKAEVTDLHAPPVINTWYTIADLTGGIQGVILYVLQENDETLNKNVEVKITADGIVYAFPAAISMAHGAAYQVYKEYAAPDAAALYAIAQTTNVPFMGESNILTDPTPTRVFEAHELKIEYRLTSAAGTNQTLYAWFIYNRLEAV